MIPSDLHTAATTTATTKRDSTNKNNQKDGSSQHGNEFVSLLTSDGSYKSTSSTSGSSSKARSSPSSVDSATSSIEDLFVALRQHERHQQRKQRQNRNRNQNQKQHQIQTRKANASTMSEVSAKMDPSPVSSPVAHTTPPPPPPPPPPQKQENNAKPGGSGDYTDANSNNSFTPGLINETTTDSSSASSDDATTEEEVRLLRRLEIKRREIDEEIEAFKIAKEEEHAEYERRLRERWRRKKEKRNKAKEQVAAADEEQEARDVGVKHHGSTSSASSSAQNNSQPRSGILKEQSRFDEEPDELPFAISSPAALMALNEQNSTADPLTSEATPPQPLTPRAQTSEASDPPEMEGSREKEVKEEKDKSPPFEEEIQLAGLFTPRYLPLLDDTYSRTSPIATSPRPITPIRSHSEPPAQSPTYTRPTSPGAPLASSLKHSSSYSSGFSSGSGPRHLKPKSPKKVSFKLDEAKPVPSRSTPPQTALTFGDDDIDPSEDLDTMEIEQVEALNSIGVNQRSTASLFGGKMAAIIPLPELQQAPSASPSYRDSLVVPTRISDGLVEVAGGGQFREGGISPRTDDHDWESVDRGDVNGSGFGSVDDDEDLFDMDETLPVSPTDEDGSSGDPNIRSQSPDFEEAIWMGVAAPSDIIATPHGLREAASLPKYSPISPFGSLGIPQSELPSTGRRGSVPFSFENLERVGVLGSLPRSTNANPNNGSSGNRNGNGRKMNGGFRKKSMQKYVNGELDAPPPKMMNQDWSSKGKSIEGGMRFHSEPLLGEEEGVVLSPATFGSSLPMAIQGREREGLRKMARVVHAVEEEEELSPGTVSAPTGDVGDDRDILDEVEAYGDSPHRPAHVHDSPSGDPLFATDEEYLEQRVSVVVDISPESDPESVASPPRRNSSITFTSPFPPHCIPQKHIKRNSIAATSQSQSPSPTSGGTTPRQSLDPNLSSVSRCSGDSPRSTRGGNNTTPQSRPYVIQQHSRQQLLNPFSSPAYASPYATPLAARVAAEAEENGFDDGIGSVVGGVDGRTGLDPSIPANEGRRGSLALLQGLNARAGGGNSVVGGNSFLGESLLGGGNGKRAGSFAGQGGAGVGGVGIGIVGGGRGRGGLGEELGGGGVPLEKMSFSMRLALEEHMEKAGSIRGR